MSGSIEELSVLERLAAAFEYRYDEDCFAEEVIARGGREFFRFRVRPLSGDEVSVCRKQSGKYKVRGGVLGFEVDVNALRGAMIYRATVDADRALLWDGEDVKVRLNVLGGEDVIEMCLLAGEKERVCRDIERISGYADEKTEQAIKN